jgi:hypothetical protein
MWADEVTLVEMEEKPDDEGFVKHVPKKRRKVYANVLSVKRSEFYAARQVGDNVVFTCEVRDYRREKVVEYVHPGDRKPTVYEVIRSHSKNGEIYELNCSLKSTPGTVGRRRQ